MTEPFCKAGQSVEAILRRLPANGPFFPYLRRVRAGDRATEFKQRCAGLGITGVSLHAYRYAWAERARRVGYPERFAQEALGHNSTAVHRAYARKAKVILPSLESSEQQAKAKILPFPADQLGDEAWRGSSRAEAESVVIDGFHGLSSTVASSPK